MALFKVGQVLVGSKSLQFEEIRVAFMAPVDLKVDQELCLLLGYIPDEKVYTIRIPEDVIDVKAEAKIAMLNRCADLLNKPLEGLKSKQDKFLTASLLVVRYRNPANGTKTEPIDAEESRLILYAIEEADWGKPDADSGLGPQFIFDHLGLTAKDGYNPPTKKGEDPRLAAEYWLIDNAKTYRIKRFTR